MKASLEFFLSWKIDSEIFESWRHRRWWAPGGMFHHNRCVIEIFNTIKPGYSDQLRKVSRTWENLFSELTCTLNAIVDEWFFEATAFFKCREWSARCFKLREGSSSWDCNKRSVNITINPGRRVEEKTCFRLYSMAWEFESEHRSICTRFKVSPVRLLHVEAALRKVAEWGAAAH